MTISLQIEQQPHLPDTPLVMRILSLPGLLSVAGSLLSPSSLPPGIRLDRERVLVDVRQLLESKGFGEIVPLIERLHVSSEEGGCSSTWTSGCSRPGSMLALQNSRPIGPHQPARSMVACNSETRRVTSLPLRTSTVAPPSGRVTISSAEAPTQRSKTE